MEVKKELVIIITAATTKKYRKKRKCRFILACGKPYKYEHEWRKVMKFFT